MGALTLCLVLLSLAVVTLAALPPSGVFFGQPDPTNNGSAACFWQQNVLLRLQNATWTFLNATNANLALQYYVDYGTYSGKSGFAPVVNLAVTYAIQGVVTPDSMVISMSGASACSQAFVGGKALCSGGGVGQYWASTWKLGVDLTEDLTGTISMTLSGSGGGPNPGGLPFPLTLACVGACNPITVPGVVTARFC